jgi:eukaryotic-like serine/threonine-protein kinase
VSKSASKKSQILGKDLPIPRLVHDSAAEERVYSFGPFHLDTAERVLAKDGAAVSLTPKSFDILLLLVENRGRLVTKDQLMTAIWPDTFVEEKTLAQNIFTLRKVLSPEKSGEQYIETVPKHGYRFGTAVEGVSRREYWRGPAASSFPASSDASDGSGCSEGGEVGAAASAITVETGDEVKPNLNQQAAAFKLSPDSIRVPTVMEPDREASAAAGSAARPFRRPAKLWLTLVIPIVAVVLVGGLVAGTFSLRDRGDLAKSAFQKINIARLTNDANVSALALSTDGKYVAYATTRGDNQALFVRQVDTTSAVQVVPPAPVAYRGITFSRDGTWVYYVTVRKDSLAGTLYRVSLLGGTSQQVLQESVDSRIEFSPDARQMAYVHWTDRSHTALTVRNVDGTGERQLAILDSEEGFSIAGPTWSPDGKTILIPTQSYNGGQPYASVVAISVADGAARKLLAGRWNWIGQMTWLADGSGIVLTAWNKDSEVTSDQIWLMSYPGAETRRLTSDVNGYFGMGVSSDARIIAASDATPAKNLWVAPGADWTQALKITNGSGDVYSERFGIAWTPDGRIIYATRQSGNPDIWMMEADGTRALQLTFDAGADTQPLVSPDGRYIVFVSSRSEKNQLWRMNVDGSNPLLLTNTEGVQSPSVSRDGQWIVYAGSAQGKPSVWSVPIGGGDAIRLTQYAAFMPAVSPDGKLIACILSNEAPGPGQLSLLSATDGQVVKQFSAKVPRSTPALRWSPDGRSLTYVVTQQGVSNIWSQPVDGGAPKALTDWKADLIYRFDWSRDGRLVCERGTTTSEVLLIRDAGK